MEPQSPEILWIVILGFIVGFLLAFSVGANDVANSFGTSVGSKVLTLRQACILATIFEVLGSVLMGYKVSNTVRKGIFDVEMYSDSEKELMLGYLSALFGSAIWNLVATFFSWPISGTHSIIGAIVGISFVLRGFFSIKWMMIGKIVASWFLSPALSGVISAGIFFLINKGILSKENGIDIGYTALPFFWGFTIFINLFATIHQGPHYLMFDQIPWWGVFLIAMGFGIIFGTCVYCLLVPHLKHAISGTTASDNSENQIGQIEIPSKFSYPEVENPAFVENGHEIPMQNVNGNGIVSDSSMNKLNNLNDSEETIKSNELEIKNLSDVDSPEISKLFSSLQILTAIFAAFAHGANDVSNAIGPVVALWLIYQEGIVLQLSESPFWIMLFGGVGISVGLWVWGQKVIQTIGTDLTAITPSSGFCIEIGAATTVLLASKIGLPISTTHCKVGSVVFVGYTRSNTAVDWRLFRNIVLAWVLTLPISAGLSALSIVILKAAVGVS